LVNKVFNIFKKNIRRNKEDERNFPTEEYLDKIKIFKTILNSYNELNQEKIEMLSQLLFNQLNSKSYSESGKHYLLDSFIRRAETNQLDKIEMILTGKGLTTSIKKFNNKNDK